VTRGRKQGSSLPLGPTASASGPVALGGVSPPRLVLSPLLLFLVLLAMQSCKRETGATKLVSDAGPTRPDTLPKRVEYKRISPLDCKYLDATVQQLVRTAGNCRKNEDCCLVWDDRMLEWDCLPANRTANLSQVRDVVRTLIRNCSRASRGCEGLEPVCRHGQCELKGSAAGIPIRAWEPFFDGYPHECPQPYTPSVRNLSWNSSEILLLTDPRLDPEYGIDLPDGGGRFAKALIEVCVSAEGFVTSARTLMSVNRTINSALEAKISRTWRFKPFVVDGSATAFCTEVAYPLPERH
jgi:hypothetical protein